ncbi:MAG TPA: MMPL family transporter [Verrucomicrobiae bacterium]|jgi:hypothetical protein|nr:MMPL family transporter [Verrucomicrobiae bacterium]
MKLLSETLIGRALGTLATVVMRHRWLFLWPQFILFVVCVFYVYFNLQFDLDRDDLVGSDKSYHQQYLKYKKEFPTQDDLVVVVESENMEKNRQFVERLGHKLELETNVFTDVFYKGDLKMMGRKALLFVPQDDLRDMRNTLTNFLPFVQQFTRATNLDSLFSLINNQIRHAKNETNADNNALMKAIPMLSRIANQATSALQRPGTPPSPGIYALFGAGEEAEKDIYIALPTKSGSNYIYLVTARERVDDPDLPSMQRVRDLVSQPAGISAIDRLRQLVADTSREVPGLNVGITGESILEHDEMAQSQHDSLVASIVSLVVCAMIFIYGYQETGRPLKATVCLIVGLAYTLAFTTLVVGHLNILTITFAPILIGLAIDFGVHLITRYEEELRHGRNEEEAMHKAMVYTGQGIFTGAMTTAAAFLAMALTNFKGIQEMGIICGGGMIVCLVPMMTLLPVMLFGGRQNRMDHDPAVHKPEEFAPIRSRVEQMWLSRPKIIIIATGFLTLLAATQFHRVYFDYDLLNMQSKGLPAVVFEKKLIDETSQSVLFAAVVADSPQQALELETKLRQLPSVSTNISMAQFLTGDVSEKLKLIGQIKQDIAPIHFQPPDTAPVKLSALSSTLYYTAGYMGAATNEIAKDMAQPTSPPAPVTLKSPGDVKADTNALTDEQLIQQLAALKDAINHLRKQMLGMNPQVASEKLAAFQQALFNDVDGTFRSIQEQDDSSRLREEDLPGPLLHRFIGAHGKLLIQVYPKKDVWNHENQEEFVKELRTVGPQVTGTPVQLLEYTTLLKNSYIQASYYALAVIAIMVFIHFRSVVFVVLALLPVAIGSCWMGGLMGAFHIPFNPANIMTLPLVIGIGVTNGIHILNRYVEERNASIFSKSTGKAVFVSGLTTLSGFGSLMLAKHQGIRSLGEVMAAGVALCMIAALTFLPAVLTLWQEHREKKKTTQQ